MKQEEEEEEAGPSEVYEEKEEEDKRGSEVGEGEVGLTLHERRNSRWC